jgi:outer membrane receptor protein involved in Fe transport
MIFDYFTWSNVTSPTGVLLEQGHYNAGEGKSDGVEFDFRHNLTKSLAVFGNFTYNNTKINDATPNGDPIDLYNLGLDYYLTKNLSFNLDVNGWMDMPNGYPNGAVWRGDGEQLVDLTIVADNVAKKPLTLTLFVHNAFDVKSHVGMTGWPGYTYAEGASYGVKLGLKI